jgi:hypothetical protein
VALGNPFNIGSTAAASGAATTVVTAGTDANGDATTMPAAGNSLFVLIGMSSGAVSPSGVADSRGNTYTRAANGAFVPGSGQSCWVYECLNPGATLVSTNTVTVTWSATTAATSNVRVIGCAGVAASAADDQWGTASGSGTAAAAAAGGALAQGSELAIAVIQSGSATGGVGSWGTFGQMGHNLHSGSGSYFGVATLDTASTAAPSASATLATTGGWGMLLLTFKASTAGAGGLSITNTSPLPGAQVGVAYSDQLTATGGIAPYTYAVTSGSLPAGIILEPGGGGGSSGDFTYVGANTGPQNAPTLSPFTSAYPVIGPIGCYKFFFGALPASWSGTLMDQITIAKPGTFCYIAWSTVMSASALAQFISTIPSTIPAVGFTFDQEAEGTYTSGADFVSKYVDQATKIRAAQSNTPVQLVMMTASLMSWYQQGGNSSYLPPASSVDVYGLDFYDRKIFWAGPDMSTNKAWIVWTGFVKGLGKPLAITEYGISGAVSAAEQNTRLQADWAYLKAAFGSGGSLSKYPLYTWLYWDTGYPALGGSLNEFLGTEVQNTWAGIAATQSGTSSTGGGGGGLLAGTPTAAGTSTPTIRVTDAASTTSSTAFSLTVTAAGALAITTTTPLPGGTAGAAYSTILTASGGTVPYTWSLLSGTLPAGLAISGQSITGTPTTAGTSAFTLKVTDNVAATATLAVALTISATLAVSTATLPNGTIGTVYTATLATVSGTPPFTWGITAGALPPGLVLDLAAGTISGTPTASGPYPFTVQVTDAGGAAATAALSIAVAALTGGIPATGRRRFGGSVADWTFQFSGDAMDRAAGATVTFWSAITGGTQYTDLTTTGGAPITSIVTDSSGEMGEFYGPSGVWSMYADANAGAGPRRRMTAADQGDMLTLLRDAVARLGG